MRRDRDRSALLRDRRSLGRRRRLRQLIIRTSSATCKEQRQTNAQRQRGEFVHLGRNHLAEKCQNAVKRDSEIQLRVFYEILGNVILVGASIKYTIGADVGRGRAARYGRVVNPLEMEQVGTAVA